MKVIPPLDRLPAPWRSARGVGFAWFLSDHVLVCQLLASHGTKEVVGQVNDWIDELLATRAESIAASGGLIILHDFRAMKTYDGDARSSWSQRIKARPKGYLAASRIVLARDRPMLSMAVSAVGVVTALIGASLRPARSIEDALAEFGLLHLLDR